MYRKPTLEGTTCWASSPRTPKGPKGEKIIVSLDKDMKTIPGFHYNQKHPELGIFEVTPKEADEWHLIQTLAGDQTDGYAGCPGIGMEKASRLSATGSPPSRSPARLPGRPPQGARR